MATCVFNCESLVSLRLYLDFEFDNLSADKLPLINLPNLKKLCMNLRDLNRVLMGVLFKCLPLLEELKLVLELIEPDHLINISAPNLRRLSIKLDENEEDVLTENCKFVIDAPNLQTLAIEGILAFYKFVSIPSGLSDVMISIEESCFNDSQLRTYTRQVMGLLRGIYCAKTIVLDECGCHLVYCIYMLEKINLNGFRPPIFHNLCDLSFIIKFEGNRFPSCLLANLRRLVIEGVECYDLEIKLVEYILAHAPVMEEIQLSVNPDDSVSGSVIDVDLLAEEYEYCQKMFKLPKRSPDCLIDFYGLVIQTSSEDVKEDGELNYTFVE
uniref:FBD domain-containing protein n=2 Tax=Chenopodium quinoa TaxID=63459 RepID=A0A803LPA3_CHEQI